MSREVPATTAAAPSPPTIGLYLELAKARLASLVVLTAAAGYALGAAGRFELASFLATLVGTALTAFGANILNQCLEVERDRRMQRTRLRPLPAGHVTRGRAAGWGASSAVVGLGVLAVGTNLLTAALAFVVIALYLLVYTPLKVRSPLNTLVGAVCGAIPPMMGWTAATGSVGLGAWILFAILFLWQIPHFLALAWMYREDYARGGFRMLPAVDSSGRVTGRMAFLYALALVPVGVLAFLSGLAGGVSLAASVLCGLGLGGLAWRMMRQVSEHSARRLFLASLLYLPLVLGVMVADRAAPAGRVEQALDRAAAVTTTDHGRAAG